MLQDTPNVTEPSSTLDYSGDNAEAGNGGSEPSGEPSLREMEANKDHGEEEGVAS